MKLKLSSKRRLVRPADALLPLAFLPAILTGRAPMARSYILFLFVTRLAGLSACTGLRTAFAMQPSARRAGGSVKLALLMHILGGAIAALILVWRGPQGPEVPLLILSAALLNIEHVFYEYLYAFSEGLSAALCRAITAVLTAAGLMMTNRRFGSAVGLSTLDFWPLAAACLAVLVSAVIGIAIGGRIKGGLNAQVAKCAPLAMLQTALWPAVFLGVMALLKGNVQPAVSMAGFTAGWLAFDLCRAPFRRSAMEARSMNRALIIALPVCLAVAAPHWLVPGFAPFRAPATDLQAVVNSLHFVSLMAALACLCGFAMFGRPSIQREA